VKKKKMVSKKQGKNNGSSPNPKKSHTALNLSDKVKILDLLKGAMSFVEVVSVMKQWNQQSTAPLNSMHPEHLQFFPTAVSLEQYTCGNLCSTVG
jgi:hypothetical protein